MKSKKNILIATLVLGLAIVPLHVFARDGQENENEDQDRQEKSMIGVNLGVKAGVHDIDDDNEVEDKDDDKQDGERSNDHWKDWSFNNGIAGQVTAVNGSSLSVKVGKDAVVFTVDASNATIKKGTTTLTLSAITVGDTVFVQGAINGSSIVATTIIDAKAGTPLSQDKKESGTIGAVTKVDGTTLTILAKNGTTYTVKASDAKVWKDKHEMTTLSSIVVGNTVIIQGATAGTTITATAIYKVKLPEKSNVGITGTVTAATDTTVTILSSDGKTYIADATDATIKNGKDKDAEVSDIDVGDTIRVQGDVTDSSIDATAITDVNLGKGFFYRFGNFFKNIFHFGKRD